MAVVYILFGAGRNCETCIRTLFGLLQSDQVAYIADNFKVGAKLFRKEIISFEKLCEIHKQYKVILTTSKTGYVKEIKKQFLAANIPLYSFEEIVMDLLQQKACNLNFYNKYKAEIDYIIKSNSPHMIPYPSVYLNLPEVQLEYEKDKRLFSCVCYGRRLYFPAEIGNRNEKTKVKKMILELMSEQNTGSPHRYFTDGHHVSSEDIFVDVGGAEAMTSLEVLDVAKHIYIFEGDSKWHTALYETFRPFHKKVTIIPKYVGEVDDNDTVCIDSYFSDIKGTLFFKVDIEGSERAFLSSAEKTLQRRGTKISICTYHYPTDADEFKNIFQSLGYECSLSPGWIFAYGEFVRGVLYGWLKGKD